MQATHSWSIPEIADAVECGLRKACETLAQEQAVYGLDALDEIRLHPTIEQCLRSAGYGVSREQRYPADWLRRRGSEGERCDFILTPAGRPLIVPEAATTMFEPADAVALEDAFWLECKIVHQFTSDGPNPRYSPQLLSTVGQDVTKLAKDRVILHAGLLLVLFVADLAVADHDLTVWEDRCLEKSLPIGAPSARSIDMTDRIGNRACRIAVYPVNHL